MKFSKQTLCHAICLPVLALCLLVGGPVQAQNLTALVTSANGRVAYMKEGTKNLQPVQEGVTRLVAGDVLWSGPDSRATLQIDGKDGVADGIHPDRTTIEVDAMSKIQISTLLADVTSQDEKVTIGVGQGRIICNVRKIDTQSESFEVKTPTVVAAVRGTQFATHVKWVNNNANVNFNVTRGKIDLLNFRGTRLSGVEEGETADVSSAGGVNIQSSGAGSGKAQGGLDGRSGAIGNQGQPGGEDGETLTAPPGDDENDDRGGGQ